MVSDSLARVEHLVCRLMCTKDKTYHTHLGSHKSVVIRAHAPPSPHKHTQISPGGVLRLGLDRAESRGSAASIFVLFRDNFEGNTAFFLAVGAEGPRDYPRSVIRSLPSVSGRRRDVPMPSVNSSNESTYPTKPEH